MNDGQSSTKHGSILGAGSNISIQDAAAAAVGMRRTNKRFYNNNREASSVHDESAGL